MIVCEIKFNSDADIPRQVFRDVQQKIDLFLAANPKYGRYSIETVLISTEPAPDAIRNEG